MGLQGAFKASILGCVCSIGALTGGCGIATAQTPQQTPQLATVSPSVLSDICVKGSDFDLSRTVIACNDAIASGGLDERSLAAAHIRRAQVNVTLGKQDNAAGDYNDALRILDKLIDPEVSDPGDLFQRAVALQGLGQIERAMSDYDRMIARKPNDVRAFLNRGMIFTRLGKFGQAIADFDSALALAPENPLALMERGNAYGKTGEFARALADLNRAIALSPANARAYVMRGVSYGHQGKNQRARADYDAALTINPRNYDALTDRAAIDQKSGNNHEAIKDLTAAIDLLDNDNDALAHYNRGVAYFALNRYGQALADYDAAIELDGRADYAYGNRCLTRIVMGQDVVKAMQDCDKAIELNPNAVDGHNIRGFVNLKLGRFEQALGDYNAALKLDPNSPHALYGRGLARVKAGDARGEADQAAARAARPNIEQSFTVFGVI
jgi:tetratricopeptide (TPR) repeat protein